MSLLDNSNLLPEVDETTFLALAFVAGYAIHFTYSKYKDRCGECFASLTKQRDIHLENQDNMNQLIQLSEQILTIPPIQNILIVHYHLQPSMVQISCMSCIT